MANDDKRQPGDNEDPLDVLARAAEGDLTDEDRATLEAAAADVEAPGLQDQILARYADIGRDLLADAQPKALDPRMIAQLEPLLGDVSHVRVHTGKLATEAARVMDARAFAVGDKDIFIDDSEFDMSTTRGRSLVAHEVAHTVDAATGFALSARQGAADHSRREEFAHQTAAAYEQQERGEASGGQDSSSGPDTPKMPKIPKQKLARMIADVLQKQGRKQVDRTGGIFKGRA